MEKCVCNMCGKEIDDCSEYVHIDDILGYGSKYDTSTIQAIICMDCIDKIIDSMKISPIVK